MPVYRLLSPAHPGAEARIGTWRVALADSGASMGRERFNALDSSPDQPDEMGLWPEGGATPGIKTPVIPDEPDVPADYESAAPIQHTHRLFPYQIDIKAADHSRYKSMIFIGIGPPHWACPTDSNRNAAQARRPRPTSRLGVGWSVANVASSWKKRYGIF